jgi:hypothetical protein
MLADTGLAPDDLHASVPPAGALQQGSDADVLGGLPISCLQG